ncbi:MAG: hypothetical protein RMM29_03015 [Planctomycetota bacterium]|nr:hypothetical protein [Planctomycetota bacterium]MCX8040024.1 hypothetical protein [Planctomycetota bacterium]MDW8372604.1 hypothetical protein [Planctomycetota bacterium]
MPTVNWSMTALGYLPHVKASVRVVALTHMSTFAALRFCDDIGIRTGWLLVEGAQPQIDGLSAERPTWVALNKLFADARIVPTEGLASGRLLYAAATPAAGKPPEDRPLTAWAEQHQQPWLEVSDNELCLWGGLSDQQLMHLLTWFICQRPLDVDWRQVRLEARTFARLRHGLFEHGWTRNIALVRPDRRTVDLWGGVHRTCLLDHPGVPLPSQVDSGLRLRLDLGELSASELTERCPLADDTGKLMPGRFSGLWSG